jgi:hypothetical protein
MTHFVGLLAGIPAQWTEDWAWGPLIVVTVIIHFFGLLIVKERVEGVQRKVVELYGSTVVFTVIIGMVGLLATLLHGAERLLWNASYRMLGAIPDFHSAVLYSLNAITSYGHANLDLQQRWQLMGALEALNGMMLFGLTTAFLFSVIQTASGLRNGRSP